MCTSRQELSRGPCSVKATFHGSSSVVTSSYNILNTHPLNIATSSHFVLACNRSLTELLGVRTCSHDTAGRRRPVSRPVGWTHSISVYMIQSIDGRNRSRWALYAPYIVRYAWAYFVAIYLRPLPRVLRPIGYLLSQEAFEKCWAHSPLRAAVTLPFSRCRYCRTPAIGL